MQGFLFSGFYSGQGKAFLDAHGIEGELTGFILVVVLIPLGFLARFPSSLHIGRWTIVLALLWNLQTHVFGYGIEDARWMEMIHIPTAFGILLLGLYLTTQAWRAVKGSRGY